uniref:C2 domain-containing protein n=1 Tax=Panagrellus redivivus TaxID=6233 RepID=A0A7E4ZYJ3_PANRE
MKLATLFHFSFLAFLSIVNGEFWLTTTIEELSFDPKCIAYSRCDIPESSFQLKHRIPSIHESKINNFPVVQLAEKVNYVSYWDYGNPESVLTDLAIVKNMGGKPNMLWFCDETSQKVLITEVIENKDHYAQYMLKGRCFNATINLQKHLSHACPWCTEAVPEVAKLTFSQTMTEVLNKVQSDNYILYPVLVAAILALLLLLVLCYCIARACATVGHKYAVRNYRSSSNDSGIPIFHTNTTTSPVSTDRSSPGYGNSRVYNKRANNTPRYSTNTRATERPYDPVACMQRYAPQNGTLTRPIISRGFVIPETPVSRISTPSMSSEDIE